MPRVSTQEFLARLNQLFADATSSGSVYLSSKRASHPNDAAAIDGDGDAAMTPSSSSSPSTYPIIFRATDGKSDVSHRTKVTTLVPASALAAFHAELQPLLRQHLSSSLRKRDKAKERKVDKDLAARRKKDEDAGGWKGVAKQGAKRGAGHRKRQRAVKRALKLRAAGKVEEEKRKRATAAAGGSSDGAAQAPAQGGAAPAAAAATPAPAPTVAGGGGGGGKKKKKGKK